MQENKVEEKLEKENSQPNKRKIKTVWASTRKYKAAMEWQQREVKRNRRTKRYISKAVRVSKQ